MLFLLLVLVVISEMENNVHAERENEINYLKYNFFDNLRNDPKLTDEALTKEKKDFIDEQIQHFIGLTQRTLSVKEHRRQKRSLPIDEIDGLSKDNYGVYLLDSVEPLFNLEATFPKDLILFEQNKNWFAVSLESDEPSDYANKLCIYQQFNESFEQIHEQPINKGVQLGLLTWSKGTFIVVAQNVTETGPKTKLLLFKPDRSVEALQYFNIHYASDVVLWEQNDELLMAICQETDGLSYETNMTVYKWLGKHFDIVQQLPTYSAQKLTAFHLGNSYFLAVANKRNDRGESNIYSEIFKYDLDSQQFVPHQRISTKSASDIKFFCFNVENVREAFLIVANNFDEELDDAANSIIYKYVEDYFIPFQSMEIAGATGWLPVAGVHGEFALMAFSQSEGVKIFQYDGWRFVTSKVQGAFRQGVRSMHHLVYCEKVLVVLSNVLNDGLEPEVYQLNFVHENALMKHHDTTLAWCKSALDDLEMEEMRKEIVGQPSRSDMPESAFQSQQFTQFVGEDIEERTAAIKLNLDAQNAIIQNLDLEITKILNSTDPSVFTADVFAKNVIVKNMSTTYLLTDKLNNISTDNFSSKVLNLENGLHTEKTLYFNNLTVLKSVESRSVNGKPLNSLLHKTDNLHLNELQINGVAMFKQSLIVGDQVNNLTLTTDKILLNEGDQYIPGELHMEELKILNFETSQLNHMNLNLSKHISVKPMNLEKIQNLTVGTLTLMGLLNDVDLLVLNNTVLRTHGDQEIWSQCVFDNLKVNNLQTDNLISDIRVPNALVQIHGGDYRIQQDVLFDDIGVQNMKIINSLNHIGVNRKGKLDVLLKNSSEVQFINGFKAVEVLKLGDVKFRGKILSKLLEKTNPVIHIHDELNLEGNYSFNKISAEKVLQSKDFLSSDGESLRRLQRDGVRIDDANINVNVRFNLQLNVKNINPERVNGMSMRQFLVTGTNRQQIITGKKYIPQSLFVTGFTNVLNINDVNMQQLLNTTLRISGNQSIKGNIVIENVTTNKIKANEVLVGEKSWDNIIVTDQDQIITGTTVIKHLKANHVESKSLQCDGSFNSFNFDKIVQDTVTKSTNIDIKSPKHFANLTVRELETRTTDFVDQNIILPHVEVENIIFDGLCNDIGNKLFAKLWPIQDDVFKSDLKLKHVVIHGMLQVDSGRINNLKIDDLITETIKIDKPFQFTSATFDNLYSAKPVILNGRILSLDLNELAQHRYNKNRMSTTIFSEITVNGTVFFNGLVSGVNVTELCIFAQGDNLDNTLVVEGTIIVGRRFSTNYINGNRLNDIRTKAWFKNRNTILLGALTFGKMHFNNEVSVSGLVGGIKLDYLASNYFSRTKNQVISASLEFRHNVMFNKGVRAQMMNLVGEVNNIELKEFLQTVLLDGIDQVFEQIIYFDECWVRRLDGDYKVNGIDVVSEVMRYDVENIVTGFKELHNVKAELLNINGNLKIQNVPLADWMRDSIRKSGSFNITGHKQFNGSIDFKKGIHAFGHFNGVLLDKNHTLLRSINQVVTGKKYFAVSKQDFVHFKEIQLSGKLNALNLSDVTDNLIRKNVDNTISTRMHLNGNINAKNVYFDKLYNGINITEFVKNLTHFAEFNNIETAYKNLFNAARKVENSMKEQAYFLTTYEIIKQFHYETHDVVPLLFKDGMHRLAAIYNVNSSSSVIILHIWDSDMGNFRNAPQQVQYSIESAFTTSLTYPDGDYLYTEGYNDEKYIAIITGFINDTSIAHTELSTERVSSLSSFNHPLNGERCMIATFFSTFPPTVVCNFEERSPVVQSLDTFGAIKAITIILENELHLIVVNLDVHKQMEASVSLWKYDRNSNTFFEKQTMYLLQPNDLSAVFYKGAYYVAVSSGLTNNGMYKGSVSIFRYDRISETFTPFQSVLIDAPLQVEFAVLPSQELILFILKDSAKSSLVIYEYNGISGFTEKIVAAGIPKAVNIRHFCTADSEHFLVVRLVGGQTIVLRAIFKGQHYEE